MAERERSAFGHLVRAHWHRAALAQGLEMLEQRATLLTNPGHREMYLNAVPSHRTLRAMARDRHTEPAPTN